MWTAAPLLGCEDLGGRVPVPVVWAWTQHTIGSSVAQAREGGPDFQLAAGPPLHPQGGSEPHPGQGVGTGKPEELSAVSLAPGARPTACLYK